jgi:ribonuclease PH
LIVDCDVIEADGGTRTASITGGFVALALAVRALLRQGVLTEGPRLTPVAAVSVGMVQLLDDVGPAPLLDLAYAEDSRAAVDLNVVMQANGGLIEVQGTGERGSFSRAELNSMLDLAEGGIRRLCGVQQAVLAGGGE